MLVLLCDALHVTPNQLLYPPEKKKPVSPAAFFSAAFFRKTALAVFIIGFVAGLSAGSEAYAPAPDTVGWHFVFSYAFRYWFCAFLTGTLFMGVSNILTCLDADATQEEDG